MYDGLAVGWEAGFRMVELECNLFTANELSKTNNDRIGFQHIYIEANKVADKLAKISTSNEFQLQRFEQTPLKIVDIY
ncbi:hypothetical protein EPI10_020705 [Gossypium australe]|uniref:RNase H type-1 domain-containing protein n=1 Tax=Gossypium australe TaxID=47621 RepID=A0A5B6WG15_9ROSI|nr:hypothetical protein EPI10_020705 [Gossypium australe]